MRVHSQKEDCLDCHYMLYVCDMYQIGRIDDLLQSKKILAVIEYHYMIFKTSSHEHTVSIVSQHIPYNFW